MEKAAFDCEGIEIPLRGREGIGLLSMRTELKSRTSHCSQSVFRRLKRPENYRETDRATPPSGTDKRR
jgi:hypothetical protein